MIIRIWAFLTRGKLVWLKDHDGRVTLSIARKTPFGDLIAERCWPYRIKTALLLDDGTVDGAFTREYVAWKPVGGS